MVWFTLLMSVYISSNLMANHTIGCQYCMPYECFYYSFIVVCLTLLVGCQEEHLTCKKLSVKVLSGEVQIICMWSSWCYCHPIISCFIKIQNSLTCLVPAYPDCAWKEAVKQVSLVVCLTDVGGGLRCPGDINNWTARVRVKCVQRNTASGAAGSSSLRPRVSTLCTR